MKIEPGFISHWKTERLIDRLGPEGIVAILRIWGNAQIRREWKGLQLTPKRLAMETKWKANENHLWEALTDPDAPWLDVEEDGSVSIHAFEEHQKQVIHLWGVGGKGGRPKKEDPAAPLKKEEDTSSSTSSSSSSSSYPICEPNENHMVFAPLKQALPFASKEFSEAWESWATHRKQIKKKLTEESVRQQFKRFAEWGESKSIASIEYTIEKGWQGLVEAPKASNKHKHAGINQGGFTGDEF